MRIKKYLEKFNDGLIGEHIVRDENVPFKKKESRNHGDLKEKEDEETLKAKRYYDRKRELGGHIDESDDDYMPSSIEKKPDVKENVEREPTDDELEYASKDIEALLKKEDEEEELEDEEDLITVKSDKSKIEFKEGYTEDDLNADMENLTYLVRQLFKNTGIEADVIYDGLDIDIYTYLHPKEKIKSLLKIFDAVTRLKSDILPQYDSGVELYQSKEKFPILQFRFEYNGGVSSSEKETKALPPASSESTPISGGSTKKQGSLFADDEEVDLSKIDSDSELPF